MASAPIFVAEQRWVHLAHPDPTVLEVHLLPVADVRAHAFDLGCACGPHEDDPGWVHHNSFDGREAYETGARRPH